MRSEDDSVFRAARKRAPVSCDDWAGCVLLICMAATVCLLGLLAVRYGIVPPIVAAIDRNRVVVNMVPTRETVRDRYVAPDLLQEVKP